MARNVEIKARIDDMPALTQRASALADEGPVDIFQEDTFFHCEQGRLKLRKFADDRGELIFYRRADDTGPKESFYLRSTTTEPDVLTQSLALAYGVSGKVVKHRVLYLAGRTRIHLDHVQDLGDYLELEVVLNDADTIADAQREARDLMDKLAVAPSQLVSGAYVDLLRGVAD